jgi:uncharacterized protein
VCFIYVAGTSNSRSERMQPTAEPWVPDKTESVPEGRERNTLDRTHVPCFFTTMRNLPQRAVLLLLRAYKWALSPILPPACRYVPTCSEYAIEAVERYGAMRGGLMSAWRLLRCHPLVKGGLDPVVKSSQTTNDPRRATESCHHAL